MPDSRHEAEDVLLQALRESDGAIDRVLDLLAEAAEADRAAVRLGEVLGALQRGVMDAQPEARLRRASGRHTDILAQLSRAVVRSAQTR